MTDAQIASEDYPDAAAATPPAQVAIGPASKSGWATSAALFLGAVVDGIGNSQGAINSQSKWLAILGAVVLMVTNTMRQLQAHGIITAGSKAEAGVDTVLEVLDQVTKGMEEQAQANVPIATVESPDNIDHAGVPQSGEPATSGK